MKIIGVLLFSVLLISCNNDENCSNSVCTEEFRTITVSISDSEGNPVALDTFDVIIVSTSENITQRLDQNFDLDSNDYPIMNDSFTSEIDKKEITVRFTGKLNEQTVTEDYIVSADCCHTFLVSGKTSLSI
ncbi:MAG: hypothetical protein AB8B73_09695 [Ekhidna sp.]